jgi:serine/threonine-protein phosphatase PGAM5
MTPERDSLIQECRPTSRRPSSTSSPEEIALCDASLAAAWAKYVRPSTGAHVIDLLVCHGNVIRWFTVRSLGVDTKGWAAMEIGNASLTIIAVHPDGSTRLVMFSDVGHLPIDRQTWTGRGPGWGTRRDR